ncbi:hypothetical protein [Nocardioides sp. AE5]|uniref:arsenate reductase/protein-tyrosine-phosphatase family protein n=1 Tax=Nocardioides sp. AE5 TaxID=2962573 RepID=UPI002882ABDB|nr:hypothetical protein [Nocardioides sp. AE5]MDT0202599.1 hypothetical protein [Nocardioides sp. AE5]
MASVLFVCIGNVCRSPLGERLLRLRLDQVRAQTGRDAAYDVASAGVRAMRGRAMHPEAARTLVERGGTPDGFVARQLTPAIVEESQLVLTATRDVRSIVLEESPRALRRTFTITEFVALAEADQRESASTPGLEALVERCGQARGSVPGVGYDIEDPIGRPAEVFDEVALTMDAVTKRLAVVLAKA